MSPGDTYVTNDPWLGTGHLHDITMCTPVFRNGKVIAFFACTAHVVDVGGRGFGADGKSVYEEGIQIPIMKFADSGQVNETLIQLIRSNVREPNQVVGDFYSLAACNDVGRDRLLEMLDEVDLPDLEKLGEFILSRTAKAMRERLAELPKGSWSNDMMTDGYDEPIKLTAKVTIENERVLIDFDGCDPVSRWGINCPMIYAKAYACYAIMCVVAPDIPNNAASLAMVDVVSPVNVVNAPRPAPVSVRHVIGHMVPDVVLGALAQALPNQIQAEGTAALWNIQISARPVAGGEGQRAEVLMFNSGGSGARRRWMG